MQPNAPASNPTTSNTNLPYGGFGQAQSDQGLASNILSYLPTQEQQTNRTNPSDTSILPSVQVSAPTVTAPTAQVINPGQYGTNLAAYNTAVQQAMTGLTGQENQAYQGALGQYSQAENQYGNLAPVYQKLASAYGLPGYQQDVNSLQDLLQNLNQDVNAQTTLGGGLMTQAARDEMYANRANPLDLALSSAERQYSLGQTNVGNLMSAYETSVQNALKPLEMNISNLPTLFGQTNQAAQSGYEQGATTLEEQIQNAQKERELSISAGSLALQQKAFNAQYGSGTMSDLLNKLAGGQIPGMSLKNTGAGGAAGYNFNVNNRPVSAGTWAATNNLPINYVLSTMASKGDRTAQSALSDVTNAGGVTQSIVGKYPSLFWSPSQQQSNNSSSSIPGMNIPALTPSALVYNTGSGVMGGAF